MQNAVNLAIQYHQTGKLKEAELAYKQIISVNQNIDFIHSNLGQLLSTQGRLDEAIVSFHRAIELNSTFLEAYRGLSLVFFKKGDMETAKTAMLAVVDLIPMTPENFVARRELSNEFIFGLKDPTLGCKIATNKYNYSAVPPIRIRIEPSSACNLRCQHCPTGVSYDGADRTIMQMSIFDEILNQMKKIQTLRECVLYLGGEPLLNKNLPTMCRRVKDETNVTNIHFNTNGMLINEKICRDLANAKVDKIAISIDGRSPEENDAIRLGAKYQTIVNNVNMLRQYLKKTYIMIANTIVKRPGDPDTPITPDFILRDFAGLPVLSGYAIKWPSLDVNKSALKKMCVRKEQADNFCIMPFTQLAIRANGDIVLCCYDIMGKHVMGNISQTNLIDIWNSQAYKNLRRNMIKYKIDLLPDICQKCPHYSHSYPTKEE